MGATIPRNFEREREISHLWADGWSYTEIGNLLGMTRSSVAGVVYRLELPKRRDGPQLPKRREQPQPAPPHSVGITGRSQKKPVADPYWIPEDPAKYWVKQPQRLAAQVKPAPPPQPVQPTWSNAVRFLDATLSNCKFIIGDRVPIEERMVCGAPTMLGKSWCPKCHKVVFTDRLGQTGRRMPPRPNIWVTPNVGAMHAPWPVEEITQ